jgi:hypothetical protein
MSTPTPLAFPFRYILSLYSIETKIYLIALSERPELSEEFIEICTATINSVFDWILGIAASSNAIKKFPSESDRKWNAREI